MWTLDEPIALGTRNGKEIAIFIPHFSGRDPLVVQVMKNGRTSIKREMILARCPVTTNAEWPTCSKRPSRCAAGGSARFRCWPRPASRRPLRKPPTHSRSTAARGISFADCPEEDLNLHSLAGTGF